MNRKVYELLDRQFASKERQDFLRRTALLATQTGGLSGVVHAMFRVEAPILVFKGVGYRSLENRCDTRVFSAVADLILPTGAVFHMVSNTTKCRASRAKVQAIYKLAPDQIGKSLDCAQSWHDYRYVYYCGQKMRPRNGFDRRMRACAGGIHFYFNQNDAINFAQGHFA